MMPKSDGNVSRKTYLPEQIVMKPFVLKALFGFVVVAVVVSQKGCVMCA